MGREVFARSVKTCHLYCPTTVGKSVQMVTRGTWTHPWVRTTSSTDGGTGRCRRLGGSCVSRGISRGDSVTPSASPVRRPSHAICSDARRRAMCSSLIHSFVEFRLGLFLIVESVHASAGWRLLPPHETCRRFPEKAAAGKSASCMETALVPANSLSG